MLTVVPIGFVKNTAQGNEDFEDLVSEIEILPEYSEGLYRMGENQEIDVLYWFDRRIRISMKVHPQGDDAKPLIGVFSSRSPNRPNPIAVTRVKLLKVERNMLTVKGLDAFDGTPVIDIKPAAADRK